MFRQHMDACGLRPTDIMTEDDIRRIRPTRKSDYRRGFPDDVLVTGARLTDRGMFTSQSAGTAGDRLVTVAHVWTLADRMHRTMDVHPPLRSLLSTLVPQRVARYAPPNCSDVECATPDTTMADRILADGTLVLPVAHDVMATPPEMVEQALSELRRWSPNWLYADPTHLALLVREHAQRGIQAPVTCRAVVLTYTQCTAAARRRIAAFFPPPVEIAEVVSMSEVGWLAMECPRGTLHLNNRSYYAELLVDGRPARVGEAADLYLTTLRDRVCPHIRYQTGDVYRLLEPCPCGHPFPALRHEGRRKDMIVRGSRVVLTPRGLDLLLPAGWIDVYRLAQIDDRRFDFQFVAGEDCPEGAEALLARMLLGGLGDDVDLAVERRDYIAAERSGKFLTCVSRVSQRLLEAGRHLPMNDGPR